MQTRTDPSAQRRRALDNDLVRLREWGTDRTHQLPKDPGDWTIGSSASCWLRLQDERGFVSRCHARLSHGITGWLIQDEGSKNGLWRDGERQPVFSLAPGVVVGIGGIRLIAESPRTIRLRAVLQRWLGWTPTRCREVDRGLRAIRELATCKTPLILYGEGNLIALARQLHREVIGADRPFIVSDPRRISGAASARSPENHASGMDAIRAATGGVVCMWAPRLPADFASVIAQLREPGNATRIIVCAHALDGLSSVAATPLRVPPLAIRGDELPRIVREYAADAMAALGVADSSFTTRDEEWIIARRPRSLPDVETATMRLVAIRAFGGVTHAASRLGITHAALSRWIGRRRLPL